MLLPNFPIVAREQPVAPRIAVHDILSRSIAAMPALRFTLAAHRHANGLRLAGCWAHLRRRFFDLHANSESIVASATVEQMKMLWAVEDEVRGQSPEARLSARRAASVDIVQALFNLWERELPRISGKSKLAEAIANSDAFRPPIPISFRPAIRFEAGHPSCASTAAFDHPRKRLAMLLAQKRSPARRLTVDQSFRA
jgi:hypothetical protein